MIDSYRHIVLRRRDKPSVPLMCSAADTKTASSLWNRQKAAAQSEQPA